MLPRSLALAAICAISVAAADPIAYPKAKTVDHVDVLHGVEVKDPFRWLEDSGSPDTRAWIDAQNAISAPYLAAIPERAAIKAKLTQLWNYERFTGVSKAGSRYFWQRNDGLQDRSVLYTSKALDGMGEVLLDPNKFEDKTLSLAGVSIRKDGKVIAYRLQRAGSDWMEVEFIDVETKQRMPDRLRWVKFSGVAWAEDGSGVYYSRYDEPSDATKLQSLNYSQKLYFHRMGTAQIDDKLVIFRPENKEWTYTGFETEDGKYNIILVRKAAHHTNAVFYRKLPDGPVVELLNKFDEQYGIIGSDGPVFYFRTTHSAPRGRIIAIDINKPDPANWKEIIPQSADSLESVSYVNRTFIAHYLKDARSEVVLFDRTGKSLGTVALPGIGRASGFDGREDDTETFYTFTSYAYPATVFRFDMKALKGAVFKQPKAPVDLSKYVTNIVFYKSKDGTRVPMFITHRKDLTLDGSNPVYLYGYGGFRVPMAPTYSSTWMTWLEMGGVLAHPGIRGGGEYGAEWHQAGTKIRKQNVFDDFVGAAEYLIAQKYTNPKRIAISGGSNGGLLVAACMLQRPDLFGVALPAVGVLDMLRFHKFTIGWGWVSDYGSPENAEEFKALYAYSPYHNVKKGAKYPATLITTADHDDRVVPAHSFKFAAALQAAQAGEAPALIRIQTKAGHAGGKPLSMAIEEAADILAFVVKNLGMGK